MSRPARDSGRGTAWLVADQDQGDSSSYFYTGGLDDQAPATTATVAAGWARVRSPQVTIGMPDHRTYWAGEASTPPGFPNAWIESARVGRS